MMHCFFCLWVSWVAVTGASRRFAFVEFETEREMHRAYQVLNIDSCSLPLPSLGPTSYACTTLFLLS